MSERNEPSNPNYDWFNAFHADLKDLDGELKAMTVRLSNIELVLAEMKGSRLDAKVKEVEESMKAKMKEDEERLRKLESFQNKMLGAMIILHSLWSFLVGYLLYLVNVHGK